MSETKQPQRKVQVWVFTPNQFCLLLKTIEERGGFWQPVTGSVEDNEAGDAGWPLAAKRELVEETGFKDIAVVDVPFEHKFQSRWGCEALERTFAASIPTTKTPKLDSREHQDYKWVKASDALKFLKFPANQDGLKAAFLTIFKTPLVGLLLLFSLLADSHAAQNAKVISPDATIRKEPSESAEVMSTPARGETLRISSESREGWFKVVLENGQFGWIQQQNILPESMRTSLDASHIDPAQHSDFYEKRDRELYNYTYGLRASIGVAEVMPIRVNKLSGAAAFSPLWGYLLNFQTTFYSSPSWGISIRGGLLSASGTSGDSAIAFSSIPIHIGAEWNLAPTQRTEVNLGIFGGIMANSNIDRRLTTSIDTLSVRGSPASVLATLSAAYIVSSLTRIYAEGAVNYFSLLTSGGGSVYLNNSKLSPTNTELIDYSRMLTGLSVSASLGVKLTF